MLAAFAWSPYYLTRPVTDVPLFSVIIPAFNRTHVIGNAVDSVLAQSDKDYEIIVVDDSSTDETRDLLIAAYGEKVTVLEQANAGPSQARNNGAGYARGRYLAFLDSDHCWFSWTLAAYRNAIHKHWRPALRLSSCGAMCSWRPAGFASNCAEQKISMLRCGWHVPTALLMCGHQRLPIASVMMGCRETRSPAHTASPIYWISNRLELIRAGGARQSAGGISRCMFARLPWLACGFAPGR
jgi:hypothetical protein